MKLPTHIRHDGFDHDQLTRTAGHALYRKSKGAGHCSYEVITIQRAKADYTWPGGKKTLKGTESYPSSTLWGRGLRKTCKSQRQPQRRKSRLD